MKPIVIAGSVVSLAISAPLPDRAMSALAASGDERPAPGLRPVGGDILFLPVAERATRFAHMERYYTGTVVKAGQHARALQTGRPLQLSDSVVSAYMRTVNASGLIVLQDGVVRLERYRGLKPLERWASFSITKSVVSILVGAAIREGFIKSINDPVVRYLPALAGSAYDDVTIEQLLSMRTGVAWKEDYGDPNSDVVRLYSDAAMRDPERTVAYMGRLPRIAPPGQRWLYSTGETDLAGELVQAATHQPLSSYLSRAIWRRAGMASDAFWLTDAAGRNTGGSGLSMTLRDMARVGQLALEGGSTIVPSAWLGAATRPSSIIDAEGAGYGYLWWTFRRGRFAARGIFGQSILVDRSSRTVIVTTAAWPKATDPELSDARTHFESMVIESLSGSCIAGGGACR